MECIKTPLRSTGINKAKDKTTRRINVEEETEIVGKSEFTKVIYN
jgi:hypothetical protein